jgi:uncharacterized membrane protein
MGGGRIVLDQNRAGAHNVMVAPKGPVSEGMRRRGCAPEMSSAFGYALLRAAVWLAVIIALSALAFFALRKWRGGAWEAQLSSSELLTKFRELHGRGGLSDDEYRTIKTKLATQIEAELKDNERTT